VSAAGSEPTTPLSRRLALLVAGAFFMEILDGTVIAPAAPYIAADLGVAAVDINLAISAYVLTLAVLIPISGWLADRFGARTVFTVAIVVFTLASAGCALATSLPVLVATRVLQGVGGALMVPVGRFAVLRTTAKSDLIRAIAFLTWPALLAPVVAPALGGLLSTYASWRWIFLINVPLGIAGLVLTRLLVPDLRAPGSGPPPADWRGFALTATGIAALVLVLENIGTGETAWAAVLLGVAVSASALAAAAVHLLRAPLPLLDLRVLRIASFRATVAGGMVHRAVISAVPFLLPLLFQLGFGWTAAQAGLVVIALFVGNVAIKPVTTPLMRRLGLRTVLLLALPASAAALVAMAWLQATTPLLVILGVLLISGVFRSIAFSAYNSLAFADVDTARMSHANTLNATAQELGAGLGVAVGALLVRSGEQLIADGPEGPYRLAFTVLAAMLLVPMIEALRLPRSAGRTVTGRT
jgi:EmrB/QacA subfamily drug resistance transporter